MTFTTFCLIAGVVSLILIAEIIVACVLCAKLVKHSKTDGEKASLQTKRRSIPSLAWRLS